LAIRGYINFIPKQNSYLSRQNSRVRNSTNFLYPEAFFTPNLLLSKYVFEKAGLYDTRIKYGDDLEFGQRAKIMGFQINFKNDLIVDHYDNPSFLKKTLRTWWGYGADRGFRLVREMRLNQYGFLNKLRLIFEFKKYWLTNRVDDFLFSTFYLVVARLSALVSVISYRQKLDEYFTSYPTLTGIKTLGTIIRNQTTRDTK
jgi:GT2 family glycosyltransferase